MNDAGGVSKKVLLVEDDDNLASVYSTRLTSEGYVVRRVADGEHALSTALDFHPDLILLDLMMPALSGFDVLDILRNTPESSDIKIVILTARGQSGDVDRAKKLGADDYLINPKSIGSPFMTIGFETTELARKELIAALHPADLTARPQIVTRATNQEYHDLISEFEKLTGIGAVLNTSLNLHGSPIVCTPKDAVEVMDNSKLDMMYFGNTLVCRK